MSKFEWDAALIRYYMGDNDRNDSKSIGAQCGICRMLSKLFGNDGF